MPTKETRETATKVAERLSNRAKALLAKAVGMLQPDVLTDLTGCFLCCGCRTDTTSAPADIPLLVSFADDEECQDTISDICENRHCSVKTKPPPKQDDSITVSSDDFAPTYHLPETYEMPKDVEILEEECTIDDSTLTNNQWDSFVKILEEDNQCDSSTISSKEMPPLQSLKALILTRRGSRNDENSSLMANQHATNIDDIRPAKTPQKQQRIHKQKKERKPLEELPVYPIKEITTKSKKQTKRSKKKKNKKPHRLHDKIDHTCLPAIVNDQRHQQKTMMPPHQKLRSHGRLHCIIEDDQSNGYEF